MTHPTFEIRPLLPGEDATAFRTLNEEWITRHFTLEARDYETLNDPQNTILRKGGHIFQVHAERVDTAQVHVASTASSSASMPAPIITGKSDIVGCVALIPMKDGIYELSKMAVSPHLRGQGIGRRLLQHAIDHARKIGATSLFLGSSKKLANAVHLYQSVGFQHVPPSSLPPTPYTRADVFMKMKL